MTKSAPFSPPVVQIRELTRHFDEGGTRREVLSRLSLDVEYGEAIALTGRSGSGKSTLLNLISGIDLPDAGSICVDGFNVAESQETARTLFRRRNIGFVYQSFNLIPTVNVADNIRLVLELNGRVGNSADTRIRELLEIVGLADRAGSYPDLLSGGEQQRVAIARAVAHAPKLILADEPTGNLDDENTLTVLQLLHAAASNCNATLILATHSPTVAAGCHRTLKLRSGMLAQE